MDTSEVHRIKNGRINVRGTPGANGEPGLHGTQGEMGLSSTSTAPGLPGANGTPGTHGTPGAPGGNGGSVSVVVSRASPGTLSLDFGDRCETSVFPITINADGGNGGSGGNGGNGGQGGHGGNGGWVGVSPEQRKFKLTVTEFPGNTTSSSAAVGYQATNGPPSVYISPSAVPPNFNQKVYLPESSKFVHKTMEDLSGRSQATPKGWNVNGKILEKISIQDWEKRSWFVQIQSSTGRPHFVVSPPAQEQKTRSSFNTETLKYVNPHGIQCEVTVREIVVTPGNHASDGGMGGKGGDAGAGAPCGRGGAGGSISIASKDASLLVHFYATADGGDAGKFGSQGTPGSGGNGGKGGRDGLPGGTGAQAAPRLTSVPGGERGSIWYMVMGEDGQILQKSAQRPTLKTTKREFEPSVTGQKMGWKDRFSLRYTIINDTTISLPPNITIVPTNLIAAKCLSPALVTTDWIQPGERITPTFEFEASTEREKEIEVALKGTFEGTTILNDIAPETRLYNRCPLEVSISEVESKVGRIFKVGITIINYYYLPVGSQHGRDVTIEITTRDGMKFASDPHLPDPISENRWKHQIMSIPEDSEYMLQKSCVIQAAEESQHHYFKVKLYYQGVLDRTTEGKVWSEFDPEEAAKAAKEARQAALAAKVVPVVPVVPVAPKAVDGNMNVSPSAGSSTISIDSLMLADVLLMIYSGLPKRALDNIRRVCSDLNLRVAIWDYSTQPDFILGKSFSSKLIIFCSEDGGLGIFNQPESILAHFFDLSQDFTDRYSFHEPPTIQKISGSPRKREHCKAADEDSSILFVTPDINETKKALRSITSSKLDTVDSYIRGTNKPKNKDIQTLFDSQLIPRLAHRQDFAVFPVLDSDPNPEGDRWHITGEIKESNLSLFQRLFVIGDSTVLDTNNIEDLDVSIRTAMTTTQKMTHLASQTPDDTPAQQKSFNSTEAALYYDLKTEFFFAQRPMFFFEHLIDLVIFQPETYTTPYSIESLLRILYRLLTAAYWRSIGSSPLSARWYHVESGVTFILKKLGNRTDFNMKAITENAKSGAKAKDRVKWRRLTLPERLREIGASNKADF